MATYVELMAQAQELLAQAEQRRREELSSVITEIKTKMRQFDISVADLGGIADNASKKSRPKSSAPAKYRGPNGELWGGGPGRKPEWVRAILAAGKSMDEFLI